MQHALPALLASGSIARDAIRARTAREPRVGCGRGSPRNETAATLLDCEGGWYATLRLPRTQSEEAWALSLLEEDGVYVHPGDFFDFRDEAYVIVSLLTPESVFEEGVSRVLARVDSSSSG